MLIDLFFFLFFLYFLFSFPRLLFSHFSLHSFSPVSITPPVVVPLVPGLLFRTAVQSPRDALETRDGVMNFLSIQKSLSRPIANHFKKLVVIYECLRKMSFVLQPINRQMCLGFDLSVCLVFILNFSVVNKGKVEKIP